MKADLAHVCSIFMTVLRENRACHVHPISTRMISPETLVRREWAW